MNYGYRTGSLSVTQNQGMIIACPNQINVGIILKKLETNFSVKCRIQNGSLSSGPVLRHLNESSITTTEINL